MRLVCDAIHTAIMKTLHYYLSKDIVFSSTSPVSKLISGKYRDLISFLVRSDVTIDDMDEEGNTISKPFSYYFINKVYLTYISETSDYVKSLLFKYYSGYTIDDYPERKKIPPSALSFIVEYINTFLWLRYDENERKQEEIYEMLQSGVEVADDLRNTLARYDSECVRKILLNIYNIADDTLSIEKSKTQKVDINTIQREVKNEFSANFNEQGK